MHPRERRRRELPGSRQEFISLRERWATLTNEALREASIDARVDHRTLAAQGINREPYPNVPIAALKMEQRGVRSEVAERIRSDYRRRVQARLERAARQETVEVTAGVSARAPVELKDVDEIRKRARELWLSLRSAARDGAVSGKRTREQAIERDDLAQESLGSARGRDDDLGL